MCAPTMAQAAAYTALVDCESHVQDMLAEYDRRRQLIVGGLNDLGLVTFEPHGAFYAFPQVTVSGMDEETFAQRLLQEEKVAVVPGSAFGLEGYIRISYATSMDNLREGLHRIKDAVVRLQ